MSQQLSNFPFTLANYDRIEEHCSNVFLHYDEKRKRMKVSFKIIMVGETHFVSPEQYIPAGNILDRACVDFVHIIIRDLMCCDFDIINDYINELMLKDLLILIIPCLVKFIEDDSIHQFFHYTTSRVDSFINFLTKLDGFQQLQAAYFNALILWLVNIESVDLLARTIIAINKTSINFTIDEEDGLVNQITEKMKKNITQQLFFFIANIAFFWNQVFNKCSLINHDNIARTLTTLLTSHENITKAHIELFFSSCRLNTQLKNYYSTHFDEIESLYVNKLISFDIFMFVIHKLEEK